MQCWTKKKEMMNFCQRLVGETVYHLGVPAEGGRARQITFNSQAGALLNHPGLTQPTIAGSSARESSQGTGNDQRQIYQTDRSDPPPRIPLMALVVLTGYPCSGKSTRAIEIKNMLDTRFEQLASSSPAPITRRRVLIINDELLNTNRSAYKDSRTERVARANFLSSTIRQLSKDQIVLCDGMNYIKGFRYQLYCAAREAGIRTCTIHIANLPERCLANNMKLPEDNRYDQETISNFFSRYEEPNSAVRWDSPLVVLPWCDSLCENGTTGQRHGLIGLEGLRVLDDNGNERRGSAFSKIEQGAERNHLEGTHGANDDLINPKWSRVADDLWLAITAGEVKPVHAAVKPATQTSANFLHLLESTTTALIESFISALKDSPESYGTVVFQCSLQNSSQPKKFSLSISPGRTINVGVLQRLKRQYTTIHKQANAAGKGASENDSDEIADNFVKYLQGAM